MENTMNRNAKKWDNLPKGWTQESVEKFWKTMTGDVKHKVTKCIKDMEGKVDDTGAFCGSLADKVDPGWRSRKKASRLASWWLMREAFNKENPVELMSQLMKILKREDAEAALAAIKQCQVTRKINDALTKKATRAKTSGWEAIKAPLGKDVTDRMIANLVRGAYTWPLVKGSIVWDKMPKHSTMGLTVGYGFRFQIRDPDNGEISNEWGEVSVGFNHRLQPIATIGVSV